MASMSERMIADCQFSVPSAAKSLTQFVLPIYGADDRRNPRHIASCVLLRVAESHFLVTAAHVLDENELTTLYTFGSGKLRSVSGVSYRSSPPAGVRANDKDDI